MATSNYRRVHPVHALNRFLWYHISLNGIMQKIPYQGVQLTPLVPIEETPTLITAIEAQSGMGSMPFIVYNWTKIDSGQMWFIEQHEIAYSIRSSDDDTMRQLINLFDDLFKKYDESAQAVNEYLQSSGQPASLLQWHFHSMNVSNLGGQMPVDTEDGMSESLISVRIMFTGP